LLNELVTKLILLNKLVTKLILLNKFVTKSILLNQTMTKLGLFQRFLNPNNLFGYKLYFERFIFLPDNVSYKFLEIWYFKNNAICEFGAKYSQRHS